MYLRLQTMNFENDEKASGVYTLWDDSGVVLKDHPTDFSDVINSNAFNAIVNSLTAAKVNIRRIDEGSGLGKFWLFISTIQELNHTGQVIPLALSNQ